MRIKYNKKNIKPAKRQIQKSVNKELIQHIQKTAFEIKHIPHDSGFFSVFNGLMNNLTYSNENDIIIPYWTMIGIKGHDFNYYENRTQNVWDSFFEPIKMKKKKDYSYIQISRFGVWLNNSFFGSHYYGRKNTRIWANFVYNNILKNTEWRQKVNEKYKKYIKPKQHINNKINNFYEKYMINQNCIGVHVRNKNHNIEQPKNIMPSYKDYFKAIKDNCDYKNSLIFLATDNNVALNAFRNEFKNNLIYQDDIDRTEIEDFRQLHRYRSPSKKLGEDVLSDCILLSKCNKLFHIISNVAIAAMYMNPKMKNYLLIG